MTSEVPAKIKDSVGSGASIESQKSAGKPNSYSERDIELNKTQIDCDTSKDRFTRREYWMNIWRQRENSKMSEADLRQEAEKLRQTGMPPNKIWEKLHSDGQCPGPVIGLTVLEDVETKKKRGHCLKIEEEFSPLSSGWYPGTHQHHPVNKDHCSHSCVTRFFLVETAALFSEFDFK
ncbi:hypothetical protein ACJMK2_032368 [Sinanodonta woodiana]|uniref:Uncharacterized protein n=1 Tax=Sinanodonta woodiana TaxID=1069815 RepID=A0ABD3X1H6_SINWO